MKIYRNSIESGNHCRETVIILNDSWEIVVLINTYALKLESYKSNFDFEGRNIKIHGMVNGFHEIMLDCDELWLVLVSIWLWLDVFEVVFYPLTACDTGFGIGLFNSSRLITQQFMSETIQLLWLNYIRSNGFIINCFSIRNDRIMLLLGKWELTLNSNRFRWWKWRSNEILLCKYSLHVLFWIRNFSLFSKRK